MGLTLRTLLLAAALALLALPAAAQESPAPPRDEALRRELLSMFEADQAIRVRDGVGVLPEGETNRLKMLAVDAAHTRRLLEILKAHGFPSVSLVGKDAVQAAFTMIVHSQSLELKKLALPMVEEAARRGDVPRWALASLIDTVLLSEGQPQIYGTRFDFTDGKFVLAPTRDPKGLAARRARAGLEPLREYMKGLAELYKVPVTAPGFPD